MLEDVLATVGEGDRCPELLGQREDLGTCVAGAFTAVDDDLLGLRDQLDGPLQGVLRRARDGAVGEDRVPEHLVVDLLGGHVAGQDHHPDAALEDRRLQGELGDAWHLAGRGDGRAVVGAPGEDLLGVGLLEVAASDLGAGDVGGDREDGRCVALAVVQPVEQVHAAGSRRAEHGGRPAGDLGVRPGGEGAGLLVAHVHELDVAVVPAQGVDDRVGRVADDAVDLADSDLDHLVDQDLRHRLGHALLLSLWWWCGRGPVSARSGGTRAATSLRARPRSGSLDLHPGDPCGRSRC